MFLAINYFCLNLDLCLSHSYILRNPKMRLGIKQDTFTAEAVRMLYRVIYCCCTSKTFYVQIVTPQNH